MTVHQLKDPCYEVTPSPWDRDGFNPHYATWHEADEALRELRAERGPDPRDLADLEKVQAKANPAGCWVGECDGCGDVFTDQETSANHYETRAELDAAIAPYGWVYRGGAAGEFWPAPDAWGRLHPDEVFCAGCKPADAPAPPLSPVQLEAAGLLTPLPGI